VSDSKRGDDSVHRGFENERIVFEVVIDDVSVFFEDHKLLAEHLVRRVIAETPPQVRYAPGSSR